MRALLVMAALGVAACGGPRAVRCASVAACGPTGSCAMGACTPQSALSTTHDARRTEVLPIDWATLEEGRGGRLATRDDTLRVGDGASALLRFRWPDLAGASHIVAAWLELSPDIAGPCSGATGELRVLPVEQPWASGSLVPRSAPASSGVALAVAPIDARHGRIRVDLLDAVAGLLRGTQATRGIRLERRSGSGEAWQFVSPSSGDVAARPRIVLVVR